MCVFAELNFSLYLGYLQSTNRRNSDIYILDTSNTQNYTWITYFDPNNLPNLTHVDPPIETPDEEAIKSKKFWFVGSIIGGVVGCVLGVFFAIWLRHEHKWKINEPYKKRSKKIR